MIGYLQGSNFTITLANLAAASARESLAISAMVGGTAYDDYMLQLSFGSSLPTTALSQAVYVWFYGSADGTNFDSPCTGADAGVTLGTHALKGPVVVPIPVGTQWRDACIPSVANMFGGILPRKWGIVVENQTNGALINTEADFHKWYLPAFYTT